MHLPDRDGSRVVLIGTSEYTDGGLPGLGPVSKNIQAMKDTFTDPVRDIVPATNCRVMLNEGDLRLVGRRLVQAAKSASDLLLVYYSGHGLIGRRSELYLGLRDSDPGEPVFTSLKYDNLRDGVLDSPALTKVIVLDCCFSGRALTGTMADPVDTAIGQTEVKGTYVLTATAMDKVALIRQNEEFTAFSGRLLKILRKGIPDGPELLSADDVFHALDRVMAAEGLPRPRARGSDFAGRLALARNHAYRPQNPKDSADRKAVDGLTYLLLEEGATLAAIAHQRLLEFANDRRQDIAEAAAKALYDARIQPDSSEIDFGRVDQGSAPPLKTVHLAGPRAARICTPRLSHDWIRLDRAGDTLGVSLDTTTRGRLNGTITLEGPTGEAEISVAANVIAVDPAPSQPLQSADPRGNESSAKRSERASQDLPGRPLAGHPNSQNTSGQKSISPPSAKKHWWQQAPVRYTDSDRLQLLETRAAELEALLGSIEPGKEDTAANPSGTALHSSATRPAKARSRILPASAPRYTIPLSSAATSAYFATAKTPIGRSEQLYKDIARQAGTSWMLIAACDWMQCQAQPRYSPVYGEKLGSINRDGTVYSTKTEALAQASELMITLARSVYGIDLTVPRPMSIRRLAEVFAAFRWGSLLKKHGVSAMEFPYSVAGLTDAHTRMRWPSIPEPNAPDKPGSRFKQPLGAVPVVLSLKYPATVWRQVSTVRPVHER